MKEQLAVWLPIALALLIGRAEAEWVTWREQHGLVPSYIYNFTLNIGDVLMAKLSWPGSEDLDLYLYRQGDELLSSFFWITRAYSPTANPEYINWTATSTGQYFVRVDLYSSIPTGYYFTLRINGVVIKNDQDTVIKVYSGLTVRQINIGGNCTMRISYIGPNFPFFLFPPQVSVTNNSNAVLSGGVNQYYEYSPNMTGNWYISINHNIFQTFDMVPFTLLIETDTARPCRTYCETIEYAVDMVPGSSDACICSANFTWNASACSINCSSIPHATARIDFNHCSCEAWYAWNLSALTCDLTCTMAYAVERGTGNFCICADGFSWNSTQLACVIVCSSISHALYRNGSSIDVCICSPGYRWKATTHECFFSCSGRANAFNVSGLAAIASYIEQNGISVPEISDGYMGNVSAFFEELENSGNQGYCLCFPNFYWNSAQLECWRRCGEHYVDQSTGAGTILTCECNLGFVWNSTSTQCDIICNQIANTIGRADWRSCLCSKGFSWNTTSHQCDQIPQQDSTAPVLDCRAIRNTQAYVSLNQDNSINNNSNGGDSQSNVTFAADENTDRCKCMQGYSWMLLTRTCEYDDLMFTVLAGSLSGLAMLVCACCIWIKSRNLVIDGGTPSQEAGTNLDLSRQYMQNQLPKMRESVEHIDEFQ